MECIGKSGQSLIRNSNTNNNDDNKSENEWNIYFAAEPP